jgi:hypothetical protein
MNDVLAHAPNPLRVFENRRNFSPPPLGSPCRQGEPNRLGSPHAVGEPAGRGNRTSARFPSQSGGNLQEGGKNRIFEHPRQPLDKCPENGV